MREETITSIFGPQNTPATSAPNHKTPTYHNKIKRTCLAQLDDSKLAELAEEEAEKVVGIIAQFQESLSMAQSNYTAGKQWIQFYRFSEEEFVKCFGFIREWAIQNLEMLLNFRNRQLIKNIPFFGYEQRVRTFYNIFHIKFTNLKKISLTNKDIRQLPAMQYPQSFNLLQNLQLSNCNFDSMSTLLFFPLHQLKRLSLNQNSIKSISFLQDIDFPQLKTLSLAKNKLSQSSELENLSLPVLEILHLPGNKFESLNFISVNKFQRLKVLNLHQNQISFIESLSQADLTHLQILNLNSNKISSIRPLRRLSLPNIREISLTNNLIVEFLPVVELHCSKGTSIFLFNSSDNYRAIQALAKMPVQIATNYKTICGVDRRKATLNRLFGLEPLKEEFLIPAYKNLGERKLVHCVQNNSFDQPC